MQFGELEVGGLRAGFFGGEGRLAVFRGFGLGFWRGLVEVRVVTGQLLGL
jgi:hypothetical protein